MAEEAAAERLIDDVVDDFPSGQDGYQYEDGASSNGRGSVLDLTIANDSDNDRIVIDLTLPEPSVSIDVVSITESPTIPNGQVLQGDAVTGPVFAQPWPMDLQVVPEPAIQPVPDVPVVERVDVTGKGLAAASPLLLACKRAMDILGAGLTLIILSPLMILAALAVATTSQGGVLYRSTRVGKDGEEFTFFKFRSMYRGAHEDLDELRGFNEQTGPVFKIHHDPRITPVGRVLRTTSVDELPQLFHVLSGKMSLVGPRPPIVEEVEQYTDGERQRLLVKPGITCIWQVSGRSNLDFDTWVDMDLEYISTWTLGKDIDLLIRTVPAVLGGRGAY